ncbi:phosphocholine cytidylyltransferase family protein [Alphaproteobacteria bacterium]|nr:phosphocholine cytidylyltransferase family protein [Alphaproteobacteria bacterium]
MKAIILAAGFGSRLRPYTDNIPKGMVRLNGMSLLELQVKTLKHCGLHNIVIVGGFEAKKLEIFGLPVIVNPEFATTNMVHSLFCAQQHFSEEMIVSYGDIVYHPGILKLLMESKSEITVAIDDNWRDYWLERFKEPLLDLESLKVNEKGFLSEIGQKVKTLDEIEGQYIGLMKFRKNGSQQLASAYNSANAKGLLGGVNPSNAYMTDLLQNLILSGHQLVPLRTDLPWVEVDTTNDLHSSVTSERMKIIQQALKYQN